jgi:hypothetical protein
MQGIITYFHPRKQGQHGERKKLTYKQKSNKHLHISLDCICGKWYKPLKSLIHFSFDLSEGLLQKISFPLA